ncbi:hypothetical protein B0H34DRAFT_673964 [Crassisporium funariophilum]|nr:hypothetical protein B0H34DRAFT_673964 [Crassisporium funariophilum]
MQALLFLRTTSCFLVLHLSIPASLLTLPDSNSNLLLAQIPDYAEISKDLALVARLNMRRLLLCFYQRWARPSGILGDAKEKELSSWAGTFPFPFFVQEKNLCLLSTVGHLWPVLFWRLRFPIIINQSNLEGFSQRWRCARPSGILGDAKAREGEGEGANAFSSAGTFPFPSLFVEDEGRWDRDTDGTGRLFVSLASLTGLSGLDCPDSDSLGVGVLTAHHGSAGPMTPLLPLALPASLGLAVGTETVTVGYLSPRLEATFPHYLVINESNLIWRWDGLLLFNFDDAVRMLFNVCRDLMDAGGCVSPLI